MALFAQLIGKFDDQDTVLGHDPHQQDQPDLRIDVQAAASQQKRKDRACQPKGHRGHHDDRRDKAFKLRSQHQKHDQDGKSKGQQKPRSGFIQRRRLGQGHDARAGGQRLGGQRLHCGQGLAQGHLGRQPGGDRHRALLRLAAELRGHGTFLKPHKGRDRHRLPRRAAHEHPFKVRRVIHRIIGRDQLHVMRFVADEHRAHAAPVEHGLQRLAQTFDSNAQIGRARAVDLDEQLRLRGVIAQPHLAKGRILLHRRHKGNGIAAEIIIAGAHQRKAQALTGPANAQAVGLQRKGAHPDHAAQAGGDVCRNLLLAARPFVPRGQGHHHEPRIGLPAAAGDGEKVGDLAPLLQGGHGILDLAHFGSCVLKRHALRCLDPQQDHGAVLGRGQFLADLAKGKRGGGGKDQACPHHQPRCGQCRLQTAVIKSGERRPGSGQPSRCLGPRAGGGFFQDAAGQHRAQRQRHDRRQQDRHRQRKAKLAEQGPGLPAQKRQWHKNRRQRGRRGHDGKEHLLGAQDRRRPRAHPLRPPPHDVFQNHDGIIHNHARGQNQRQKHQDVDRESGEPDSRKSADQGHRQRNGRDQGRPQIHQKGEDHGDDDEGGQDQRQHNLIQRALHENRVIRGDLQRHIGRQQGLHILHHRPHRLRDRQCVRLRRPDDAKADPGLAIGAQNALAQGRAKADLCHIAQTHALRQR